MASELPRLDRREWDLLVMMVNDRIIEADKAGIPRDDPSSLFRLALLHKLILWQQATPHVEGGA